MAQIKLRLLFRSILDMTISKGLSLFSPAGNLPEGFDFRKFLTGSPKIKEAEAEKDKPRENNSFLSQGVRQ
ncbi:hypothetical protein O3S81_21485 [Agrobacterium sp. SOY23]|uniref:hypothetical protein n=1 Tax=Agrobacterium sp. SOY23 TaxID=3014555 RepID=UPI001B0609B8|nr:hypothetical protein [Agrobacterium sp. SOY23]MBO9653257.1 hypothetical protein [Agrobacterium tumefaciens]MCZ4432285.1 hypothetical protein [Agrobacterium sp. SOY23]